MRGLRKNAMANVATKVRRFCYCVWKNGKCKKIHRNNCRNLMEKR